VITPLLFDAAVRRAGRPGLRSDLVERSRAQIRKDAFPVLDQLNIDVLLQERPVTEAIANGLVGVPLFTEENLDAMIGDAERYPAYEPQGRRWEFWQTETGYYAMFPADDDPRMPILVTATVVSGTTVQFRRFATGLAVETYPDGGVEFVAVVPEACILESDVDVPGAPYRGRCANSGCSGACTPLVFVNPDDGLYRLVGCNCP
jgi:hypothetical protein